MNCCNEADNNDTEMASTFEEVKTSDPYDFRRVDEEINDIKLELLECRKEYQSVETEICQVTQLNDKGLFILKDRERKYKQFKKELNIIHSDYVECVKKVNSYENVVYHNIQSLTLERNNLKTEIHELRKRADKNNALLAEIKKLIIVQEKKNLALLRRLKKMASRKILPQDMKEKINAVLRDPRITGPNIPNQNIV